MEPLLVYPDPPPPVLAQGLDLGGYPWTAVGGDADIKRLEPEDGWPGAGPSGAGLSGRSAPEAAAGQPTSAQCHNPWDRGTDRRHVRRPSRAGSHKVRCGITSCTPR